MEKLTIEQAFGNIQLVIEQYKGTKQEHIILEQSLVKIKESLNSSHKEDIVNKNEQDIKG